METAVSPAKEETAAPAKPGQPAKVRLDDSVLIRVKSNTYGQLIYVNKRTGDRTEWSRFGEEQSVTMGDLRAMKGTQLPFFSDQMIVVTGCDDERYPDLTPAEIYDALLVSRYYKNIVDPAVGLPDVQQRQDEPDRGAERGDPQRYAGLPAEDQAV